MAIKEVHFSEARQQLSQIVDQVEKSGKPVTILRHGKPVAVVMSHKEYEARAKTKKPFKLAGSLKFRKGIDVDKVIAEGRKEFGETLDSRRERLLKELQEP